MSEERAALLFTLYWACPCKPLPSIGSTNKATRVLTVHFGFGAPQRLVDADQPIIFTFQHALSSREPAPADPERARL